MKYKLHVNYDGTEYGGWQVQPNRKTIQEYLQDALKVILRKECKITGSGRTDAGVHAKEQVAHFSWDDSINTTSFLYSLNSLLPKDIRAQKITLADKDFHARYSVKRKIYHYHLHLSKVDCPFHFRFKTKIHSPLDLDLIEKALPHFIGTHDFSTFRSSGCGSKDPVKTLYRLEMVPEEDGVRLEFEGDGFLYKMVRNIVGTLLEVGSKKRDGASIPDLILSKDRTLAGPTAPPQGLFLSNVLYE